MNKATQGRLLAYETVYAEAQRRGREAGEQVEVQPMVVEERVNPLDDTSVMKRIWHVPGGVCGFAWVLFPDCRSPFVKWLLAQGHAGKRYGKSGATIWIYAHGQSYTRKKAHAEAMCDYFRRVKIKCSVGSELD
jgi:hypothetical protein